MSFSSKNFLHQHFKPHTINEETGKIKLEIEQVLEAGRQIKLAIFGNLFIGLLTIYVMLNGLPKKILIIWTILLIISILLRVTILFNYHKVRYETLYQWKGYFISASLFSGFIWGIGAVLIEMYGDEHYQGIAAFILGGMASGAIAINTPIRYNYPAFILPMLLLLALYYFSLHNTPNLLMGIMVIIFIITLWTASVNFRKLQFEKHALLQTTTDTLNELHESEQRLKDITTSMGEGVFVVDKEGHLTFINPQGERLLGWSFDELTKGDEDIYEKIHKEDIKNHISTKSLIKQSAEEDTILHSDLEEFKRKNGEIFPVSMTAAPIYSNDERKEGVVVVFQDITHQKELESKLEKLALYDALTGLYNRGNFNSKLKDELERANRYEKDISLLLIDIDFFKKVNDTYGHQAGDKVLKSVANIITSQLRSSDYAARYGGEEFVIILPETSKKDVIILAERIRTVVEEKVFEISKNKTIHLTISIGASSSLKQISPDQFINIADNALYKAKENGRNQVQYL